MTGRDTFSEGNSMRCVGSIVLCQEVEAILRLAECRFFIALRCGKNVSE